MIDIYWLLVGSGIIIVLLLSWILFIQQISIKDDEIVPENFKQIVYKLHAFGLLAEKSYDTTGIQYPIEPITSNGWKFTKITTIREGTIWLWKINDCPKDKNVRYPVPVVGDSIYVAVIRGSHLFNDWIKYDIQLALFPDSFLEYGKQLLTDITNEFIKL